MALVGASRATRHTGRMYTFVALAVVLSILSFYRASPSAAASVASSGRRLQSEDDGACASLTRWDHAHGLVVYIIALLYLFLSLATVCDEYFVEVLERITDKLGLSPDVAGATFMAAGSSAPELFVSLADNVLTKPRESMGVGAIVGSAIFNILIIISFSAFFAGQVLVLDWRPLVRDSLWYCYAIVLLTVFISDGQVETWEAGILFISYVGYCCYMKFNEQVIQVCCKRPEVDVEDDSDDHARQLVDDAHPAGQSVGVSLMVGLAAQRFKAKGKKPYVPEVNPLLRPEFRHILSHHGSLSAAEHRPTPKTTTSNANTTTVEIPDGQGDDDDAESLEPYFACLHTWPSSLAGKLYYVLTYPILVLLRLTIPDTRYPRFSGTGGLIASFTVSILWICGLSNFTVQWATKVGCLLHIPSTVMGLTIVAMGTSVPDALSSILVARSGKGDMAVSNAIGSNCFDIMCGLGLPFFLSTLIYKEPAAVVVDNLKLSIFLLFGVLVTVIILLALSKWRLHPIVGGIMVVLYVAYVIFNYLHDA